MTAVKDTLPVATAMRKTESPIEIILHNLASALFYEWNKDQETMVYHVRGALADIRAWRKSLPGQSMRQLDGTDWTDRNLIRNAVLHVTTADGSTVHQAHLLRRAEADLRTLIKRNQKDK